MPTRLNFGCGPCRPIGWLNVDRWPGEGIRLVADVCDGPRLVEAPA